VLKDALGAEEHRQSHQRRGDRARGRRRSCGSHRGYAGTARRGTALVRHQRPACDRSGLLCAAAPPRRDGNRVRCAADAALRHLPYLASISAGLGQTTALERSQELEVETQRTLTGGGR
jgi:hypothetical protein